MSGRGLFSVSIITFLFCHAALFAQRYEAESATLTNGAAKLSNAQLSGGFYVALNEGNLTLNISVPSAGYYNIFMKAASSGGQKNNIFGVDANTIDFKLTTTVYETLKLASALKLSAGTHTVKVLKSWGYINIDFIEVQKISASDHLTPNRTLVTPNPTNGASRLYQFLYDNYGSKIITGVMTLNSMDEVDWLKTNTGKEPALLGLDFLHNNRNYEWFDENQPIDDAKDYYLRNGIPAFTWHWRDPSRVTESFNTSGTSFDVSKVTDENSTEYQQMIADIDYISGMLKKLQDDDVPVIWRPMHEAAGGWFWWGAKGPEPCKKLYQVMYDRMVNHHGLKNLIWVWTQDVNDDDWYPGDDYVDIVGRDVYKEGDHNSQILEFATLHYQHDKKKIVTMSESGSFPDPDKLIADKAAWSWFMPWYGDFVRLSKYNSLTLWNKMLKHEYAITLDEMPDISTYEAVTPDPHPDEPILGDEESNYAKLNVFPTRVEEQFTIESDRPIGELSMLSASGKMIFKDYYQSNRIVISCRSLPAGLYIIRSDAGGIFRIVKL